MELIIKETKKKKIHVKFSFPFYRHMMVDEKHHVYYKFENYSKMTRIEESRYGIKILALNEPGSDIICEHLTEEVVGGLGSWSIIKEDIYNEILKRLTNKLHES